MLYFFPCSDVEKKTNSHNGIMKRTLNRVARIIGYGLK